LSLNDVSVHDVMDVIDVNNKVMLSLIVDSLIDRFNQRMNI